jgi:hypothetical protein
MQGTLRTRSAGAALGFGALAGCFALSAPALAIAPTDITHSEITSPTGPFYTVFNADAGATNEQFTFSGTSDGDDTDTVDIRCYNGGPSYSTIIANVPVAADGTFTSAPTDLAGDYDDSCNFKAIQTSVDPADLSSFTGPWAGVSESDTYKISGDLNDGKQYDFFADLWQRAGHAEYDSVSNCGIDRMEVLSPLSRQSSGTSWNCAATLGASDPVANGAGRSMIEVDGRQAYGSTAARNLFSGPDSEDNAGFQPVASSVAQDPVTGNGKITDEESFVACPDGPGNYPANNGGNCSSFQDTGVKLSRTFTQGDDGRTVNVTDAWSSTDGAGHDLKLHYSNAESGCCGDPQWTFPGQEPSSFGDHDVYSGPFSGPQTLKGRTSGTSGPSTAQPAFALTWDTAPQRARFRIPGCCWSGAPQFLLDYGVSVPATGTKTLRFAYQNAPSQEGLDTMSTRARDGYEAPTVTITSPANGSTVNTPTVNVAGKALDNVGVASLVVNGTSVTPSADGTYSVPVSVAVGANTLTATVKDASGLSATATETVTYTPPPAPAAVKCVVPSVKKGGKVSSAKKLLTKAHCKAGKTVKKHSKTKKGRVLGLANKAGKKYAAGKKVNIIVSSGPKAKKHSKH